MYNLDQNCLRICYAIVRCISANHAFYGFFFITYDIYSQMQCEYMWQ